MKQSKETPARRLALSGLCLALCLLLPFVTGSLQQLGNALCPMHIPVFLCAYLCGGPWAAAVGLIAPLLRFALFQAPPIFPTGAAMSLELATYGLVCGLLYRRFPGRGIRICGALLGAMLAGRLVWGAARYLFAGLMGSVFSLSLFWAGAVVNALPGIVIQLLLIPAVVGALERAGWLAPPDKR